jgi:hypothetical protein
LDLKFMVHHGDFIVQHVSGIRELVGSDVNLVHRLMKNHVFEATGWKAYALFTDPGLAHLGLRPEGLHPQPETYEHLGEVRTFSLDLHRRYTELKNAQRNLVSVEQADAVFTHDFPAAPAVMWDWTNEPARRVQWSGFDQLLWFRRADGRTGAGARSHCVHGSKVINAETVLDWRPFEYYTLRTSAGPMLETVAFEPLDGGQATRLQLRFVGAMPLPRFIRRPMMQSILGGFRMEDAFAALEQLVRNEQTAASASA